MKIKHWQGYGCVEARKITDKSCTLHVRVKGNHEYGIVIPEWNTYTMHRWLVQRFDKSLVGKDYDEWERKLIKYEIIPLYDFENHMEVCDYKFTYERI